MSLKKTRLKNKIKGKKTKCQRVGWIDSYKTLNFWAAAARGDIHTYVRRQKVEIVGSVIKILSYDPPYAPTSRW